MRRFFKQCTKLPSVTHVEVINAFLEGTTCRNLVHELARSRPANTNELFDAATNYATGEKAVGAIFDDKPNKRKEDAPAEGGNAKINAPAKKQKWGRKEKKQTHQSSVDQGRRKTPTRPSSPPRTAKDLEAPIEVEAAYSTTC